MMINTKATKEAKKEAKTLKKEGWQVAPGALPLEKQLERCWTYAYQEDDNGMPKYTSGEAKSIGEVYDAARLQANELAKQELAGKISSEITELVENSVANKQLAQEEAASVVKTLSNSKSLIEQSLGRTITGMECYRKLKNGNTEVLIRTFYLVQSAHDKALNAMREELEKSADGLSAKVEKIFGK